MITKKATARPSHPYPYLEPVAASPIGSYATVNGLPWTVEDFPHQREWMELYMELFSGAGRATYLKRAERLGNYGWVPEDLRRVCSNPREVAQLPGSDYSVTSEDQAEALAALVHEASIYYSNGHSLALSLRLSYVARLSTSGWALSEVASLLGMTRQRVHAMLKEWRKGQPRKV